jgi:hypothetical protein
MNASEISLRLAERPAVVQEGEGGMRRIHVAGGVNSKAAGP